MLLSVLSGACSSASGPAALRTDCASVELLVAASDYQSSVVCGAPGCELSAGTTGVDLGADPQLSFSNGRAFFIARTQDLVFELDPTCATPIAKASVHDLGPRNPQTGTITSANPHDAAVAPDGSVFLPLYNVGRIAILRDGKLDGPGIDLSSYDADGNPQAESIRIVDVNGSAKAFVTLERLDDTGSGTAYMQAKQPSLMLRIDVATRTVEAAIELAGRNPFNVMAEHDGVLYLAEPRNFDAADEDLAGIERFDTKTSTSSILVTERALGASVSEVAVTDGCGVAIVAGPAHDVNPTSVVTFDPTSGAVVQGIESPLLATAGYDLQGLAWRGDTLYVGDRRAASGGYPIHVFERTPGTCSLHDTGRTLLLPSPAVALRPTPLSGNQR
ncbi:hypothetical protein AKJ09_06078 [Labilithrix luteola]|uniref:Uncharacterized protein n=1 Tax=Labilithrix luteola TaxID=1391654 RepID=A0A0K1Q213_9BACT|nr:hypothetical protein AKJ09_06078 [Labilithrix luteola]